MLHVRGPDINETPSQALARVHQFLYRKYAKTAKNQNFKKGSAASAALLQEFLTAWKIYVSRGGEKKNTSNIFTNEVLKEIKEKIIAVNPEIKKIFRFKDYGGQTFEINLTTFIYTLLESYGSSGLDFEKFKAAVWTGPKNTNSVKIDTQSLDDLAYQLSTISAKKVSEELTKTFNRMYEDINKLRFGGNSGTKLLAQASFRPIQQKVDINMRNVTTTIIINKPEVSSPFFYEILNLLANAKFTLKNYGTGEWIEEIRKKRGWMPEAIALGDTNVYRAVTSVLSMLGWKADVINSVYYATFAGQDKEALKHSSHLRFIYELTGLGQFINGEYSELNSADYLIWNDHKTNNIVVRSTAELIQELMDGVFNADLTSKMYIRFVNLQ